MPPLLEVFPALETSRLRLIQLNASHASDLYGLFTDERVTQYYTVIPINAVEDLLPVIAMFNNKYTDGAGIRWAMTLKNSSDLIGTIGFQSVVAGHKGAIVFALMPKYWQQGYMREAISAVTQFGFAQLALKRIEAEVMPGNNASARILQKAGFAHDGLLRQWVMWQEKTYDMDMYSLLNAEPDK